MRVATSKLQASKRVTLMISPNGIFREGVALSIDFGLEPKYSIESEILLILKYLNVQDPNIDDLCYETRIKSYAHRMKTNELGLDTVTLTTTQS